MSRAMCLETFVVSLFILFIVWKLVTRHLTAIARFVGDFDIRRSRPPPWSCIAKQWSLLRCRIPAKPEKSRY